MGDNGADADLDNDGLTNVQEFEGGFDPNQSALEVGLDGRILCEKWVGVGGNTVAQLRSHAAFPLAPDAISYLEEFNIARNSANNYGVRLRAQLTIPQAGAYTLWISSDDYSELWLSPTADPVYAAKIAHVNGATGYQNWTAKTTQKSATQSLFAGQVCYIEAIMKEAGGGDHLSVAWTRPDGVFEIIPASHAVSYTYDPDDADQDNLDDAWESTNGLDSAQSSGDNGAVGDPDGDGFTNLEEFLNGTDPLDPSHGVEGYITLERYNYIPGAKVANLIAASTYPGAPDVFSQTPTVVLAERTGDSYGCRFRGFLRTPSNGLYRLAITSDDQSIVYLAASESPFDRQAVCQVTGWSGVNNYTRYASQMSDELSCIAGEWRYIEILFKEGGGGDHLSLQWILPNGQQEAIPASALKSWQPHPEDADHDGLPDAWESAYGLDPAEDGTSDKLDGSFGDFDGDGIPNLFEYQNLLLPDHLLGQPGSLLYQKWDNITSGPKVDDLRSSTIFSGPASHQYLIDEADPGQNIDNHFGSLIRGYLIPTNSGHYTISIASDDHSELWLGADSTPFDRKLVAHVSGYTGYEQYNKYASQRSRPVFLNAGELYYIEVLHKEHGGGDHVTLAWTPPQGELQKIPSSCLKSFEPHPDDQDFDGLKDSWEVLYGLNPADVTRNLHLDEDQDGLTLLEEMQNGTNPFASDTDADGITDGVEVHDSGTNPLDPEVTAIDSLDIIQGANYSSTLGNWPKLDDGQAFCRSLRGEVSYQFTNQNDGALLIEILAGSMLGNSNTISQLPLRITLDGEFIYREKIRAIGKEDIVIPLHTPSMASGVHNLSIWFDNYVEHTHLRIREIRLNKLVGPDANANGLDDWLEARYRNWNSLEVPSESYVSPVCLQGTAKFLSESLLNGEGLKRGADEDWYQDVSMSATGVTELVFQTGHGTAAVQTNVSIEWVPFDVANLQQFTLRKGDALRLWAYPQSFDPAAALVLDVSIPGLSFEQNGSSEPVPFTFDQVGQWQVSITCSDGQSTVQASCQITVVEAQLPLENPAVWEKQYRPWALDNMDASVTLQSFGNLAVLDADSDANNNRSVEMVIQERAPESLVARLGDVGPVIASADVDPFIVYSTDDTYVKVIEVYPNGDRLVETAVVSSPVLESIDIELTIFVPGVMFEDGTKVKVLNHSDFDEIGVATVRLIHPAGRPSSVCHRLKAWQGNVLLGSR